MATLDLGKLILLAIEARKVGFHVFVNVVTAVLIKTLLKQRSVGPGSVTMEVFIETEDITGMSVAQEEYDLMRIQILPSADCNPLHLHIPVPMLKPHSILSLVKKCTVERRGKHRMRKLVASESEQVEFWARLFKMVSRDVCKRAVEAHLNRNDPEFANVDFDAIFVH